MVEMMVVVEEEDISSFTDSHGVDSTGTHI